MIERSTLFANENTNLYSNENIFLRRAKGLLEPYIDVKNGDWSLLTVSAVRKSVNEIVLYGVRSKRELQKIAVKKFGILIPNNFFEETT